MVGRIIENLYNIRRLEMNEYTILSHKNKIYSTHFVCLIYCQKRENLVPAEQWLGRILKIYTNVDAWNLMNIQY